MARNPSNVRERSEAPRFPAPRRAQEIAPRADVPRWTGCVPAHNCGEVPTAERHRNNRYRVSAAAFLALSCLGGSAGYASASVVPAPASPSPVSPSPAGPSAPRVSAPSVSAGTTTKRAVTRVPLSPVARVHHGVGTSQAVVPTEGAWALGGVEVGTVLTVPMALGGLVAVFMVMQWLIDRRDPRLVDAPSRQDEDSVGFE